MISQLDYLKLCNKTFPMWNYSIFLFKLTSSIFQSNVLVSKLLKIEYLKCLSILTQIYAYHNKEISGAVKINV